jgi:pimeloyl-ACP methyl ester carboxylesterase
MAQVDRLAALVPHATLLKLARCGHSPHRDQPEALIEATARFVRGGSAQT